jgi:hypothetical protein
VNFPNRNAVATLPTYAIARGALAATTLWLLYLFSAFPRVARSSQPWAGGRNPVGIEKRWRQKIERCPGLKLKAQSTSTSPGIVAKKDLVQAFKESSAPVELFGTFPKKFAPILIPC